MAVLVQIHAVRWENGVYYKFLLGHLVTGYWYHLERSLPDFQDGVILLGSCFSIIVFSPASLAVGAVPGEQGPVSMDVPADQGQQPYGHQCHRAADDGGQGQAGVFVRFFLLLPIEGGGRVVHLKRRRLGLDAFGCFVGEIDVAGFHGNHAHTVWRLWFESREQNSRFCHL